MEGVDCANVVEAKKKPSEFDYPEWIYEPNKFSVGAGGKVFTDNDFPPTLASLFRTQDGPLKEGQEEYFKSLQWRRAPKIFKNAKLFSAKIDHKNIEQGRLGNCYFVAALASLASIPNALENVFLTKRINE